MDGLMINGANAWQTYGIMMGKGFLDAINTPDSLKDFISNESRLEHGTRLSGIPKMAERSLSLTFNIHGDTPTLFKQHKDAFLSVLMKGKVTISNPKDSDNVYRLVYTGKNLTYAQNTARTFCKLTAGFTEPDPSNRSEKDNNSILIVEG